MGRMFNMGMSQPMTVMSRAPGDAPKSAGMVMVQTTLDPARLVCSPQIDPAKAPTARYEGKTYFFCSVKERDEFLTDPAMSLSMMPPK